MVSNHMERLVSKTTPLEGSACRTQKKNWKKTHDNDLCDDPEYAVCDNVTKTTNNET